MPDIEAIEIRVAAPEDAADLLRIIDQVSDETDYLTKPGEPMSWADRAGEFLREQRDQRTGVYLLALADGGIVGFLGAYAERQERTRGALFIAHVGLRASWRGHGIGARMFAAVEDWARVHEFTRLDLRVDETNQRGLALYHRCGFVRQGTIPEAAISGGAWHAHHWMAKRLAEPPAASWPDCDPPLMPGRPRPSLVYRALVAADAALLCEWERQLLSQAPPLWLKRPEEVSSVDEMARYLGDVQDQAAQLRWAALVESPSGSAIVGYLGAWPFPGKRMGHEAIFGLNVLQDFAGLGIGRRLATRLFDWAEARGLRRLSTVLLAHNRRGRRFAEAQGFACEVSSPGYTAIDGLAVDLLRYGRLLRSETQASEPIGA